MTHETNDLETIQAEKARDANLISNAIVQLYDLRDACKDAFDLFDACDPEPLETLAEALRQWQLDRDVRINDEPF